MSEAKPLTQCSVFKEEETMEQEGYLEHVIKTEEVDLEPDYIECNTDVDTDMTDMDEQTENCDIKCEFKETKESIPLLQNDQISQQNYGNSVTCQDIKIIEIKLEVDANDEASGSELSKLHESEADTVVHKRDTEHVNNLHISDIYNESRPSTRSLTRHTTEKHIKIREKPTCDVCKREFRKKHNLIKHFGTYTGEKIFSCRICEYKTTRKCELNVHIMSSHNVEKPYMCKVCKSQFSMKSNLDIHMKRHTGEKPYQCNICGHKSTTKSELIRHMSVHTGVKPYACNICDFKCSQKSHLNNHIRRHAGEKRHSCNICYYKCLEKSEMTKHIMRVHNGKKPHSCNICDYKCSEKTALRKHMRIHTGEKPFSCDLCDYKCTQKSSLILHKRVHTGEKPFSCFICNCKFSRKQSLNLHMKTHAK